MRREWHGGWARLISSDSYSTLLACVPVGSSSWVPMQIWGLAMPLPLAGSPAAPSMVCSPRRTPAAHPLAVRRSVLSVVLHPPAPGGATARVAGSAMPAAVVRGGAG